MPSQEGIHLANKPWSSGNIFSMIGREPSVIKDLVERKSFVWNDIDHVLEKVLCFDRKMVWQVESTS